MMTREEIPALLPCPFCGGEGAFAKKYVYCADCGSSGRYTEEDKEMNAEDWNKRYTASLTSGAVEAALSDFEYFTGGQCTSMYEPHVRTIREVCLERDQLLAAVRDLAECLYPESDSQQEIACKHASIISRAREGE